MAELQKAPWSDWETVRLIGRGSFGTVYEIQRKLVDGNTESAALKIITIPQNPSDVEEMYSEGYDDESVTATFNAHLKNIVAEYSLMRKMNGSSNIVNCDDVRYVQHNDGIGWDIFIRMELLTPLMSALPVVVSEDTVIKVAKDICTALVLCKKHGIVHRDIKPQNIFVSPNGDYKLGDFGIAKIAEKTMGGTKIGTYKYMAPEVYNNQPYGSGADIYSLGLVLYWLLNERRMPFMPLPPAKLGAGMDEEARCRRLSGEAIPEPAHGSDELKRIVLKACAYDPKERFVSAAEMLEALNKLNGSAAVVAPIGIADVDQSEDLTIGPVFRGGQKENDSKADQLEADATVGPLFGQEKVAEQTDAASAESSDATTPCAPAQKDKKSGLLKYILIALGVIAIIVIFLLLLRFCDGTPNITSTFTEPSESITASTQLPSHTDLEEPSSQPNDISLTAIAILTSPIKTSYYVGETLNTSGLTLTATYNDGTAETITSGFTCAPSTLSTAGTQNITVSYGGKTVTFSVSVTDMDLQFLSEDVTLRKGESFNLCKNGAFVADLVNWSSSDSLIATVDNGLVTAVGSGIAIITAEYQGQTVKCIIRVKGATSTENTVPGDSDKDKFSAYGVTADDIEFSLCKTPENPDWNRYDLSDSDYRSKFSVGEKISLLGRVRAPYYASSDTIEISFVVSNKAGTIVTTSAISDTWLSMWYQGYCELDVPKIPEAQGEYVITVYFNDTWVSDIAFTITY